MDKFDSKILIVYLKSEILSIAHCLVNDKMYQREEASEDLIKVVRRLDEEEPSL